MRPKKPISCTLRHGKLSLMSYGGSEAIIFNNAHHTQTTSGERLGVVLRYGRQSKSYKVCAVASNEQGADIQKNRIKTYPWLGDCFWLYVVVENVKT